MRNLMSSLFFAVVIFLGVYQEFVLSFVVIDTSVNAASRSTRLCDVYRSETEMLSLTLEKNVNEIRFHNNGLSLQIIC